MDSNHTLVLHSLQSLHHLEREHRLVRDRYTADIAWHFGFDQRTVTLHSLQIDNGGIAKIALNDLGNVPIVEEHVLFDG